MENFVGSRVQRDFSFVNNAKNIMQRSWLLFFTETACKISPDYFSLEKLIFLKYHVYERPRARTHTPT